MDDLYFGIPDFGIPDLPKEAYALRSSPFVGVDIGASYRPTPRPDGFRATSEPRKAREPRRSTKGARGGRQRRRAKRGF